MLKTDRKSQAQACFEVLLAEGFTAYIGTKPHNCHIVSVFTASAKNIHTVLSHAFHNPVYEAKKIKGKNVFMLHFRSKS